jgi:CRISPR-associated exonuclease Cas4
MQKVTGTLIWYYYICPREVWLMAHELNPNQEDSFLEIGRLLGEDTYKREKKEIIVGNMKIDLMKRGNGETIIGEIKKSSRFENSARMQLAFYLHRLRKRGIEAKGELLIPKEKKRIPVELTEEIESELKEVFSRIERIMEQVGPPEPIKIRYCTNCAYREFCWV